MRLALRLAQRGYGQVSPNPLVGAVLVKKGKVIGRGWHRGAGGPHGEIEALLDAEKKGNNVRGATLYVTLEPCCTHGRTPPCTDAILRAGIKRVVVAGTDPNPNHAGKGFEILKHAGVEVVHGIEEQKAEPLNEAFNHWIVHRTPFVTVKAAMTLDGKIATAAGESKWITGEESRAHAMTIRQGVDAILVGINTVLFDDPSLTVRGPKPNVGPQKLRLVLDPRGQTPLTAKLVSDDLKHLTTIVTTDRAPKSFVSRMSERVRVIVAPVKAGKIDLHWLLKKLGKENITSLLVEGGGETNALFLRQRFVHRVAFFYAPTILCGRDARKGVAGEALLKAADKTLLHDVEWKQLGADLFLTARITG
ncbi:MAG: Riboflavin biosynthesis protein RibD [Verrucomicrobiales bacterium]|nr:Riboflavin biosynthesis protein RibD [Verrucomicrobiales bacterium]